MRSDAYELRAVRLLGEAAAVIGAAPRAYLGVLGAMLAAQWCSRMATSYLDPEVRWQALVSDAVHAPITIFLYTLAAAMACRTPANDWSCVVAEAKKLKGKIAPIMLLAVVFFAGTALVDWAFGLGSLAISMVLVALAFYLFLRAFLVLIVLVETDGGAVASLRRSWALTRGKEWALFKLMALIHLPAFAAMYAYVTLVIFAHDTRGFDGIQVLSVAFMDILFVATTVMNTVALVCFHNHLVPQTLRGMPDGVAVAA